MFVHSRSGQPLVELQLDTLLKSLLFIVYILQQGIHLCGHVLPQLQVHLMNFAVGDRMHKAAQGACWGCILYSVIFLYEILQFMEQFVMHRLKLTFDIECKSVFQGRQLPAEGRVYIILRG